MWVIFVKSGFNLARALVWLTQFGLSVAAPPVLFILGAVWLRDHFGLGGWIVAVGVVLGVLGAFGGFISSLKTIDRLGGEDKGKDGPAGFNDHK